MIRSFGNKDTEKLFSGEVPRKLPNDILDRALIKLETINAAVSLNDLVIPKSNKLEKLKGDRIGQYSIRINDQWRICFVWESSNAFDVEITDYH